MGDGRETTVLDLGGVEGDRVLWELEAFLDEGGELSDATPLLAENFLGVCCANDSILLEQTMRLGSSKGAAY